VTAALAACFALAVMAEPPRIEELIARADAAWEERDTPERFAASRAALDEAQRLAPDEYAVLWRLARADNWIADDPALDGDARAKAGKRAWDLAEKAMLKGPARVEGYLYAALGMGNYALTLGILKALREGIEAKFLSRMRRAEAIDRRFLYGTIQVAWGRYYDELPWPKHDAKKAEAYLKDAMVVNPANVRARVYLAELYMKEKRPADARRLLDEAIAHRPGAYDAPEERRMQARARQIRAKLE
jgi:tetratricopeptide (TPR) repeat protein